MTRRERGSELARLLAGLLAGSLVLGGFIYYLALRAGHAWLANDACFDTGGCKEGSTGAALLHDLAGGLGMLGLLLSVGFGLNYATTGTRARGFVVSLVVMLGGVALWLVVLLWPRA